MDIAELLQILVAECEDRGFRFLEPGCWGFGCRATKSASGTTGATPSFHSWGLGVDVNAPLNVFGADRERTQLGQPEYAWFIMLWREYGFYWLGPAIGDWMHFSFCGDPHDAAVMTAKARDKLMRDDRVDTILEAERDFARAFQTADGDPGPPPETKPALYRETWNRQRMYVNNPKGAAPTGALKPGDVVKLVKP